MILSAARVDGNLQKAARATDNQQLAFFPLCVAPADRSSHAGIADGEREDLGGRGDCDIGDEVAEAVQVDDFTPQTVWSEVLIYVFTCPLPLTT